MLLLVALVPSAIASRLDEAFAEVWTTRDGLPHSTVNVVEQTADGYLWLATWEGIARYDGTEFRLFRSEDIPGLGDDGIRAMHLGPSGDLWAGSGRGGVVRLHRGRWTALPPVPGMVTDLLEEPGGRLWVATVRSGIVRVDGRVRRAITAAEGLPSDAVTSLDVDRAGRVWVGTAGGLARIEGDRAFPVSGGGLPEGPALSVLALDDGRLLVGTEQGAYVGREGDFAAVHPGLAGDAVIHILRDPDGTLWFGTIAGGLARVRSGELERLEVEHGLPNARVLTLRRDREGSLWIGTNGGMVRLREAPIRTFTRRAGLSDEFVRAVLPDDGGVWIGTSKGLNRLDASGRGAPVADPLLAEVSVLSLELGHAGSVWVGTFHDGALLWDGRAVVRRVDSSTGLLSNEVRAILAARDGRVWIGSKQGLAELAPDGRLRLYRASDGLPGDYVQSLHEDVDGVVWVGTGSGLGRVRGGRAETVDLSAAADAQYIFDFAELGRELLVATDRGLVRIDRRTGRMARVSRDSGLPLRKIFAVVPDPDGRLWLTGSEGVARLGTDELRLVFDGRRDGVHVRLFGPSDGLATSQANGGSNPAAALGPDGHVWVATAQGVARIDPRKSAARPPPLAAVVLERFDVDGRPVDPVRQPRLPAGSDRIEIRVSSPSLLSAHRLRYRYRLEGFSDEWVDLGSRREVQFTNLDPGPYALDVEVYLPGEDAAAASKRLDFEIAPHWWQLKGVWLAAFVAALALLFTLHRGRVGRLRASERRLQALVEQKTAALKVQTDLAERLARTDALTALANRRALDEALHAQGGMRSAPPVSLALVDIDHFKRVNDAYSHLAGDAALRAVADVIRAHSRHGDVAARWGGEEFALLLPDCAHEQAQAVAERIREAVERMDCSGFAPGLELRVSVGIATAAGKIEPEVLVRDADRALMRAKELGRNRVCVASPVATAAEPSAADV